MADKKVRFINLNNQILTLGGDGILSFPDIATMASEPIANLQNGAIGWVDSEQKYFQWLDTNEISEMGYWKELIFGSDFQISDPTTSADDDRYKGKVIQYVGEDDLTTGFKKGYFYESKLSNTINYVETVCTETSTGTYYILRDGEYLEVVLLGDGTTFDPSEVYYKKQDVEVYGWFYINALRVDTELADTDYAIANKTVKAKFEEVIQDYTDKNTAMQEYIDGDLTDNLKQYTDDKINDSEEEVFEDKTWSSSKTKDYIDTNLEKYTESSIEILQAEFEALDEETRLANNYYCTDTGRIYNKNVLYGEKKTITLSSQAEYDQMKADGKIESDVDYVIEETEQNVNAVIGYVPIGVVFPYCATTPPVNYLICDGSLYEKTAYPELYSIIGNAFGGDNTTFAVPNLTDRFIQGGTNVGEYVEAGLPNIEGVFAATSNRDNTPQTFTGSFERNEYNASALTGSGSGWGNQTISFDASRSNSIYGNSDTVQPPSVVLLYIIKCK